MRIPTLAILFTLLTPAAATAELPLPCGFVPPLLDGRPDRERPDSDHFVDSDLYPIRVHYLVGDEGLVDATLEAAELSWEMEVEQWGWEEPGSDGGLGGTDGLDYYLADTEFGGYASPDDWWEEADNVRCVGHIVINRLMDPDSVRITVPHEFNHVLQMWTDCAEDPQLFEASAVQAQDFVYPEYGSAWGFAAGYQEGYWRSLDYYDYAMPPQYGSFIFLQFLTERFGDGTPAETVALWEDATQGNWNNDNRWMDALERWLTEHWADDMPQPQGSETRTELAWQEFAEWRYFLGANWIGEHLQHGSPDTTYYGIELPLMGTASLASLEQGPVEIDAYEPMAELSSGAALIRHPEKGWVVHADLEADGDRWALTLVSLDPGDDTILERVRGAVGQGEASVSTTVVEDTETIVVLVAQVGDGDLDNNADDWDGVDALLTVWVEQEEEPADDDDSVGDDDDDDDDDDGRDCSCSAAPLPHPPIGVATVGLSALLLGVRRRR